MISLSIVLTADKPQIEAKVKHKDNELYDETTKLGMVVLFHTDMAVQSIRLGMGGVVVLFQEA